MAGTNEPGGRRNNIWYNIINYGFEYLGRYYSSYRAFVIDNDDPENLNRLLLRIPQLNDAPDHDTWAWPKNQWGGKDYGVNMLPVKGDMVWVEFEFGSPDNPIWSHAGYAEKEKPEEFKTPRHYGFKTPRGTKIIINDNKDTEEILVKLSDDKDWIKINKDILELESKLIKLGQEGQEWAVMGDTLKNKLDKIMDKLDNTYDYIINHIHTTNVGPSGPPINSPKFIKVKSDMNTIKGSLSEILSETVKIDK